MLDDDGELLLRELLSERGRRTDAPDEDALNAAVAEAVAVFKRVVEAHDARRAALKPRPRYTVCDGDRILDGKYGYCLAPQCIAGLLNAQEKP